MCEVVILVVSGWKRGWFWDMGGKDAPKRHHALFSEKKTLLRSSSAAHELAILWAIPQKGARSKWVWLVHMMWMTSGLWFSGKEGIYPLEGDFPEGYETRPPRKARYCAWYR